MADRYTAADAFDALQHCDPGQPRREWVRLLAAAKDAGLSFEDALSWSASAQNFKGDRDVRSAWNSIKPGEIKAGTLFHEARAGGWQPRQATNATRAAPPLHPEMKNAPRAGNARSPRWSAAQVWDAAEPATAAHAYVIRKNGTPEGLRACTLPVRIGGADMAGALLVPLRSLAGELVSLQFIPAEGPKMNLPGHPLAESLHVVGELQPEGVAYVCEGLGQAWACWQATGRPAVVAVGWGRVRTVASALLALDPGLRLVLVPDAGKEADAQAIAAELGCQWAEMPAGSPRNFDANDYAAEHGAEALAELLERVRQPEPVPVRFRLLTPADLLALPAMRWRVKGVIPAVGVAAVFGPSASGKSFLCFDLAAAIAAGRDWFGYRVKPAPVVYVPLEGEAGFRLRAQAWQAEHGGAELPEALRLVMDPFKLTEAADVEDLAAVVAGTGLEPVTIVDTLNRAAPEADENASADMGRVIEGAKALQRLTGGLVILVHHTGKDASRGLRGHSSLFAALDAAIEVTRDHDDRRAWQSDKVKDGKDGDGHPFTLHVHELGEDDDGDPVTSCAVRPDTTSASEHRAPPPPKGKNQRIALDALRPLFKASTTQGRAGAPPLRHCIELEAAITAVSSAMTTGEQKRPRDRAREAIDSLIAGRHLCHRDGWLWLP